MSTIDTLSPILGLLLMGDGLHNSDWGDQTNANLILIENAISSSIVIGEMKEYYGVELPNSNFVWANGQALDRTVYSKLLAAITRTTTLTVGGGATACACTENLTTKGLVGAAIEGPGIPNGTYISGINSATVYLSQATSGSSGPQTVRIFPYGNGNGSTSFTVPDRRECIAMGATFIGTSSSPGRLPNTLGSAVRLGSRGGEDAHFLSINEMPSHTHGVADYGHNHGFSDPGHTHNVSDPGHAHGYTTSNYNNVQVNSGSYSFAANAGAQGAGTSGAGTGISLYYNGTGAYLNAATTGIQLTSMGGNSPHNNMPPVLACSYIMRAM